MTINGTDFRIQQKGAAEKGNLFVSHKYAGKSMLSYKLGVDILAGNLVWVKGPYPTGTWPDVKIFNSVLLHCLELRKQVEANNGYVGHAKRSSAPPTTATQWRNLGCRVQQGLDMRCSTGA
jgi:hypothetical protein